MFLRAILLVCLLMSVSTAWAQVVRVKYAQCDPEETVRADHPDLQTVLRNWGVIPDPSRLLQQVMEAQVGEPARIVAYVVRVNNDTQVPITLSLETVRLAEGVWAGDQLQPAPGGENRPASPKTAWAKEPLLPNAAPMQLAPNGEAKGVVYFEIPLPRQAAGAGMGGGTAGTPMGGAMAAGGMGAGLGAGTTAQAAAEPPRLVIVVTPPEANARCESRQFGELAEDMGLTGMRSDVPDPPPAPPRVFAPGWGNTRDDNPLGVMTGAPGQITELGTRTRPLPAEGFRNQQGQEVFVYFAPTQQAGAGVAGGGMLGAGGMMPGGTPVVGGMMPGMGPGMPGGMPGAMPGAMPGMPGATPGMVPGLPGGMPGGMPGAGGMMPGMGPGMPGGMPGAGGMMPGMGPGMPGGMPGMGPGMPGGMPGAGGMMPGGMPGTGPGMGPGMPGAMPGGVPGMPGATPGMGPGMPGMPGGAPAAAQPEAGAGGATAGGRKPRRPGAGTE